MGTISASPMGSVELTIFGDQAASSPSILSGLAQNTPSSRLQAQFVDDVSEALRAYVDRIPAQIRRQLPQFQNLRDLVRIYIASNGACHPAIGSVVICAVQLLHLFRVLEQNPHFLFDDQNALVVGLCTGGLVTAAYAASSNLEDLHALGVPTVVLCFDIGMQTDFASRMVYEQGATLQSWSMAIADIGETEATAIMEDFAGETQNEGNLCNACFLGAVTLSGVSINGPPPALKAFQDYLARRQVKLKPRWLPIYAAYHAPHIHNPVDLSGFLERCEIDVGFLTGFSQRRTVISPRTGELLGSLNALELFRIAINDTLCEPLRLDRVIARLISTVRETDAANVQVTVLPPSAAYDRTVSMLSRETHVKTTIRGLPPPLEQPQILQRHAAGATVPLAIVGMSGRFPGAESVDALWTVLEAGLDMHKTIPHDRFDIKTHVDATEQAKNTASTPYGCFVDNPGHFDPRMFNMSPREAMQTDPMQRLALVTAYEALEMAGFVANRTPSTRLSRVGTFYGQTSDDYRDTNAAQDIGTYFITGGIRAFGPGRINYHFKFGGPSYSIDTACSSGLAAIQLACSSLWSRECDTAVAGGLSILSSPDLYSGLSRGHFLSKSGPCRTFDNDADGYCRADGIGSVVLKRLDSAQLDRDNILAVVLGAATNHSTESVSITRPHAGAQAALYDEILYRANTDPLDVSYVEMHGTGTQAGDGVEMTSVLKVLAPESLSEQRKKSPLYVGSIKANIGHGEASSGVSALIKAMLMFEKASIPRHVGIKNEVNRTFPDLAARGVHIPKTSIPFPKSGKPRKILVNNFSAAGGNTAILIEEPPSQVVLSTTSPFTLHAVTVSGHTESALRRNTERLLEYLSSNPSIRLCDLAYTTTVRRQHHRFRLAVADTSVDHVRAALANRLASCSSVTHKPEHQRRVAFVFTGQGPAYPGIARALYAKSGKFRIDVDSFDSIARRQGFPTFMPLIDGSSDTLDSLSAVQVQVGLVCIQMALARLWCSWGVKPAAVLGHSLGEYAALHIAGVLSAADTIFLTGHRATLMEERCKKNTHSMLAVAESPSRIPQLPDGCTGHVEVACINSPQETVFAGENKAIGLFEHALTERKIRCKRLPLPYAFHSSQIDPILEGFEQIAKKVHIMPVQIPIVSTVTGQPLRVADKIDVSYLTRHSRQAVQFSTALETARDDGILDASSVFLELGPHPVCLNMVRATLGSESVAACVSTLERTKSPWDVAAVSLCRLHESGVDVDWAAVHRESETDCSLLHLPPYAFDDKNYWIDYCHDWSLRKGDPPSAALPAQEDARQQRLASSVHRVVTRESISSLEEDITYETDLWDPQLHTALCGHRVNGAALCPSSVYADMAFSVVQHTIGDLGSSDNYGCRVADMSVTQPLIITPKGEQRVLRINARHNTEKRTIMVTYESSSGHEEKRTTHATCTVEYGLDNKWSQRWTRSLHLVESRICELEAQVNQGEASKVSRGLAYSLFKSLVDYTSDYQRMERILFASQSLEASATVQLDRRACDKGFVCSPYWIDSLAHISGFVMNANDTINTQEVVYISHGWESMWFHIPLAPHTDYQTYVKMCHVEKSVVSGDVWILHEGRVAGVVEGLRFQRIPRSALDILLPKAPCSPADKQLSVPHNPIPVPHKPISKGIPGAASKAMSGVGTARNTSGSKHLIADILGIPETEISPDDSLDELGMDSLACLTLASRLTGSFEVRVPNSKMMECTTVGQLTDFVSGLGMDGSSSPSNSTSQSDFLEEEEEEGTPGTPLTDTDDDPQDAMSLITSTIIQESGVQKSDLEPDVELGDLGIDSLMALTVVSKLRTSGLDLPLDFFHTHTTIGDVTRALIGASPVQDEGTVSASDNDRASTQAAEGSVISNTAMLIPIQAGHKPRRPRRLFLFPDGSGSPGSYARLGDLHPAFEVHGLVCPFIDNPDNCSCGIEDLVRKYLETVRKEQPTGPYHLGGWSVGGVLAFEAARQLHATGQETRLLLLLDAPCPAVLPPMPASFIDHLETSGVLPCTNLKSEDQRRRVLGNFNKTVNQLSHYKPISFMQSERFLHTTIVRAEDGVSPASANPANGTQPDGEIHSWILENRADFGPDGWEQLLPRARIDVVPISGNHFSMMELPNVQVLSDIIGRVLTSYQ